MFQKAVENIKIIGFEPGLSKDFKDLNIAWLEKYFIVEPVDEKVLNDPQREIIDKGGYIFFATSGNAIACTVSL